jgi:hypothetical protein
LALQLQLAVKNISKIASSLFLDHPYIKEHLQHQQLTALTPSSSKSNLTISTRMESASFITYISLDFFSSITDNKEYTY